MPLKDIFDNARERVGGAIHRVGDAISPQGDQPERPPAPPAQLGGAAAQTNPGMMSSTDVFNTLLRQKLRHTGDYAQRMGIMGDELISGAGLGAGSTANSLARDRHNALRNENVDEALATATSGYLQAEQNERTKEAQMLQKQQFDAEQAEKQREYDISHGFEREKFGHTKTMDYIAAKQSQQKMKQDFQNTILNYSLGKFNAEQAANIAEKQTNLAIQVQAYDQAYRDNKLTMDQWIANMNHVYQVMGINMRLEDMREEAIQRRAGNILKATEIRMNAVSNASNNDMAREQMRIMTENENRNYQFQLASAMDKDTRERRRDLLQTEQLGRTHELALKTHELERQRLGEQIRSGKASERIGEANLAETRRGNIAREGLEGRRTDIAERGQALAETAEENLGLRHGETIASQERMHRSGIESQERMAAARQAFDLELETTRNDYQLSEGEANRALQWNINQANLTANERNFRANMEDKAKDRRMNFLIADRNYQQTQDYNDRYFALQNSIEESKKKLVKDQQAFQLMLTELQHSENAKDREQARILHNASLALQSQANKLQSFSLFAAEAYKLQKLNVDTAIHSYESFFGALT